VPHLPQDPGLAAKIKLLAPFDRTCPETPNKTSGRKPATTMDESIFDQITSALTVQSLCSGLAPDIPAGSRIEDLEALFPNPEIAMNHPSRVVDAEGNVIGILWFENWGFIEDGEEPYSVDEVTDNLQPNDFLSASTTILDAVEYFGKKNNRYFYVIHRNEVVGVLYYSDLFKPLGRIAFLSLALEIEDQALRLCQAASIRERCWLSLSDNRRRKAIEVFKSRYKREPKSDGGLSEHPLRLHAQGKRVVTDRVLLIECTNLVDKATMIWKQKLIAPVTQADVLGFFNDLKEIRDQCAHPGGEEELIPKKQLARFVHSARRMRISLREAIRNLEVKAGAQS